MEDSSSSLSDDWFESPRLVLESDCSIDERDFEEAEAAIALNREFFDAVHRNHGNGLDASFADFQHQR